MTSPTLARFRPGDKPRRLGPVGQRLSGRTGGASYSRRRRHRPNAVSRLPHEVDSSGGNTANRPASTQITRSRRSRIALLRRSPRRLPGGRERFRATRHRRVSKHRRRISGASRLCHRFTAARAGIDGGTIAANRLLRPLANDASRRGSRPRGECAMLGFAGNPDGLRHRHLFQLRGKNPRRFRRLGLPPNLHRGPRVRCEARRVVDRSYFAFTS